MAKPHIGPEGRHENFMKMSSTGFTVAIIVAKLAAIAIIAALVWNCWVIDQPGGMRKQDFEEARWLITIAAVASSAAVLLLTRRNFVRVLINTPILLVCTILGILVGFWAVAMFATLTDPEPRTNNPSIASFWLLVLLAGACGAIFGHILLAIGWALARIIKWRTGSDNDRGPPDGVSIPSWRWQAKGSDAG